MFYKLPLRAILSSLHESNMLLNSFLMLKKCLTFFVTSFFFFIFFVHSQNQLSDEYASGQGGILKFYQKYISPVKGVFYCPMYPSCSQYAKIEFANKNPITAYFDVFERLIRCGNDLNTYQTVKINGVKLFKDTVKGISSSWEMKNDSNNLFINQLEKEKDYYSAILEYKRLIFYEKDSSLQLIYLFRLARCCFYALDDNEFYKVYDKLLTYPLKKYSKDSLNLYQALIYYRKKDYINTSILLGKIVTDSLKFKSDIAYIQGLCLTHQHNWAQAESSMKKVLRSSDHYSNALKCYNLQSEYEKINLRKPYIGLISSIIIPGSGYFYAKKPMTGFAALFLNGLFFWAAYDALHSKQYGMFSTIAVIGSGWYFGSIIGSWRAVDDLNNRRIEEFIDSKTNY